MSRDTHETASTRRQGGRVPPEISALTIHALARLREVRAMLEPPPYGGQIAKVRAKAALLERDLCGLADEIAKLPWGDAPCVVSGGADGGCPTGECDPAREPAPRDVPNGGEVCAKVEAARAEVLR